MKIVIWIGCFLVMVIIQTLFTMNGIQLGAIPTVILFLIASAIAKALCKKWDENH